VDVANVDAFGEAYMDDANVDAFGVPQLLIGTALAGPHWTGLQPGN
jgi:hypothetical protein